ncbi:MAG: hypothetical protein IT384_18440 [Deltaproteobacteria bacterium]|nr:hypothetical protein [Deltaproteobacteria bacterium]
MLVGYLAFFLLVRMWLRLVEPAVEVSAESTGWVAESVGANELGGAVVLAAALVLGALFAGGYMIAEAPVILGDVALELVLATALLKTRRARSASEWASTLLRRTIAPAAAVMALAIALGIAGMLACPSASTMSALLFCVAK